MQALLVQIGNVAPTQMRLALQAATDLASGLGIDLESATIMVAKALEGSTGTLGRYGIGLDSARVKAEGMTYIAGELNQKFGGQAQAQLETYTGRMAVLTNQISDFKERVGELMVNALTPLLNAFGRLPEMAQTSIVGLVAIGAALAPLALSFAAVSYVVGPLIPMIGTALVAAIGAISAPVAIVIAAAAALVLAFYKWREIVDIAKYVYEGVKEWMVDKFQAIVAWVQAQIAAIIAAFQAMYMAISGGSIVPDLISDIESEFGKLNDVMVQPVIRATRIVTDEFAGTGSAVLAGSVGMAGASAGGGSISIPITINGSVLSNASEIARVVGDAVTQSLRQQGWRAPA
jgi:hypothetical protein